MPRKIKIAFQGGGAKFIPLLAAAQAFRNAEKDREIEVTAVSGTSAGAIVACLYSANIDLNSVRQHLRDKPEPYLRLVSGLSAKRLHLWSMARKIWYGTPLISEEDAKSAYRALFQAVAVPLPFPQLAIPTRIIAADIVTRSTRIYDSTELRDRSLLLQAVVWDSCGLPFVFKSHSISNGVIVDGGICENLPADCLIDIRKDGELIDGDIIGVSFEDISLQIAPQSTMQFAMALMDTAIENSMRRARRVLEDRVVSIKTDIGTWDFRKALSPESLGASYQLIIRETRDRLKEILDTPKGSSLVIKKDNRAGLNIELQRRMARIYETQFAGEISYEVLKTSMVVIVNSLRPDDYKGSREDVVTQIVDLVPREKPLQCYMMSLGTSGEFVPEGAIQGGASWQVFDGSGASREVTVMPMVDENSKSPNTSAVLIFFTPPLAPIAEKDSAGYRLLQRDYLNASMEKLKDSSEKREQLALNWSRSAPARKAEIVVFLPDIPDYWGISLKYHEFTEDSKVTHVAGRAMTKAELNKYLDSGLAPQGMVPFGWVRDEGLKAGEQMAFELAIA